MTETQFAPLPVRRRGNIEIFDTAFKLFRRYFGVLIGWSAIVAVASLVPYASILAWPLIYGLGACCIAAAVRGQRISFGQVWDFTKPRYGALIGLVLLAGLLLGAGIMAVVFGGMIIGFGSVWVLESLDAPPIIGDVLGVIAGIALLVGGSVASVLMYAWLTMVPIIACLEDDKRGPAAMGRAWSLIRGSWLRVVGLSTLLTIAIVAAMAIALGSMALLGQTSGIFTDSPTESVNWGFIFTFSAVLAVFFLFWNPIQTLIIAVLYLDLRVRKEALDLEWTSYATAPPPAPGAQPAFAGQPAPGAPTHLPTDADRAAALGQPTSAFAGAAPASAPPPRPPAPNGATATAPPNGDATTFAPRPPAPVAVDLDKPAVTSSAPPMAPTAQMLPDVPQSAPVMAQTPATETSFAPQPTPPTPSTSSMASPTPTFAPETEPQTTTFTPNTPPSALPPSPTFAPQTPPQIEQTQPPTAPTQLPSSLAQPPAATSSFAPEIESSSFSAGAFSADVAPPNAPSQSAPPSDESSGERDASV